MELVGTLKTQAVCFLCGNERQCAHFPFDDERPDDGLGPWCCKSCWVVDMTERRYRNERLPADSPDRLRVLRWPLYAKKPLQKKTQGKKIIITSREMFRVLPSAK